MGVGLLKLLLELVLFFNELVYFCEVSACIWILMGSLEVDGWFSSQGLFLSLVLIVMGHILGSFGFGYSHDFCIEILFDFGGERRFNRLLE